MRITFRLIASLLASVTLAVLGFTLYQVYQERERLIGDLDRRGAILSDEIAESAVPLLAPTARDGLGPLLDRLEKQRRVAGLVIYGPNGEVVAASRGVAARLPPVLALLQGFRAGETSADGDESLDGRRHRIHAQTLPDGGASPPTLVLFQDAAFIEQHVADVWQRNFFRLLVHAFIIVLVTLLVVRGALVRPMDRLAGWIRDLRMGKLTAPPTLPSANLFKPLADEIETLAKSYHAARAAAEEEARLRERGESVWTADRLKERCRTQLRDRPLIVVSNREPYMHVREDKAIRCIVPASGLVTALEPILRACGGTWVAHGSGSADRETVDGRATVPVPPDDPKYTLRRVWLSREDEEGYYYGFSNEGMWPLCHIAHTRPLFKPDDWEAYRRVNAQFAGAVREELMGAAEPCVLIQDYHFALLPRLVKELRSDARVAIFWHIPWPNPEAFGICPWQRDILHGMLGADLIGFHTQFHCNNFLETVDRVLEARVDWERFAVNRQDHVTHVKPFPISVAFTGTEPGRREAPGDDDRARVAKVLGFSPRLLGVGVDRVDYTKGIVERFRAIERFLVKYPAFQGRFTFVELGAPSRTRIPRYHDLGREVEAEAARINGQYKAKDWRPIVLLARHHSHAEIEPFYRAADLCLVTSLHDGMNLVAKEYIATRDDEQGVLILSQFAGASRELRDALIVNPYDIDQSAEAVRYALEMEPPERRERMRRLRAVVRDRNVYRWAAELIGDLAQIRLDRADPVRPTSGPA